jgi:hypothetical protein
MLAAWFTGGTVKRAGFEDVLAAIQDPQRFIIINTLSASEQDCLISNTMPIDREEQVVNEMLSQYEKVERKIILYGKNSTDTSVDKKYRQLLTLGISEVYVYYGGLFEWMLLQDIFGEREFPTTRKVVDILKYRGAGRTI